jgi:hypothetical protein
VDAITPALIAVGVINLLMFPVISWFIKRSLGQKLDTMDEKREQARAEQAEDKQQRDAERTMVMAIARTMLLNNYEKCIAKGYYTVDEREVYSLLYDSYKSDKGNGVIDAIAKRIRELPTEPPREHEHDDK